MSRGMRARSPPHLGGAVLSRIRPQIEKCASAVDVRTMAIQDCAQIRIQDLVAYARRQCLKFSHDPSLPAIEKGERSEEHTSELQSLMRISYAVFCLKKKNSNTTISTSPLICYYVLSTNIHHPTQ